MNIKHLSENAAEIFRRITKGMMLHSHRKYNNSAAYMPLSVEYVYMISGMPVVSLCHYGEQNGDLMRDPEMLFYIDGDKIVPFYYRNDYAGVEQTSIEFEEGGIVVNERQQSSQAEFAELWMMNIQEQQGI